MLDNRLRRDEQLKSGSLTEPSVEPMVVVCAADDNYSMPLAVTVRSVLENLNSYRKIILFIIDGGIKNHNKQKILKSLNSEICEIQFVPKPSSWLKDISEELQYCESEGIYTHKHVSLASYYRLFISELIPYQYEKAIYLDCDLLVKEDLEKLWQIDIGENYLLAVQDIWIHNVSAPNGLLNYQELEISPYAKYFNAGVFVINLTKWRDNKIAAKAVEYFKQNKAYVRFHDQDILNALLAGRWGELDPRWNFTAGIYEYSSWKNSPFSEDAYNNLINNNPYIIHFAAAAKPWNSSHALLKEHFFDYVDMTAWSGWRLTLWRRLKLRLMRKFQNLISKISKYR